MTAMESPLRLAALALGILSIVSMFFAPAASFLSALFGALVAVVVVSESKIMMLVPLVQIAVCVASLYYLGEALLLGDPSSLALGVVLSVASLLMVYVEGKMLLMKRGIGKAGAAVVAIVSATLLYTYGISIPNLEAFMEEEPYGVIELTAYCGLLYIGASLPYSSAILFGLIYIVYDLLRSIRLKEVVQPSQEAREVRGDGVVPKAQ